MIRIVAALIFMLPAPAQEEAKKPRPLNVGGIEGAAGGTVSGIVKFKGKKPARRPVAEVAANPFCKDCHKEKLPLGESWVYGKNGDDDTLQNVLVYVSKGLEGKTFAVPKEPVVLDQVACIYTPHVVGAMAGQKIEIRTSDPVLHNVMCNPRNNPGFNVGMSIKGDSIEKSFPNPELRVDIRCVMHPWMLAWVHVLPHPFHAETQGDGTFTIRGLPPGEYEVAVLHESSRFASEPAMVAVKVAEGETKKLEFAYSDRQE